jgi:DNA repair ATPase RecN
MSYKVLGLNAQNVMKLKVVEINADGKSVILTGENEAGKSTVIDTIMMTLSGKMVERPIRDGEERAEASVDLGEYRVKRVWTKNDDRLEVTSKDGAIYRSPQTLLNGIIGKLSFDPLAFMNMERKPQRDLLVQLVGLDFTAHDAARKQKYDERTIQNRLLDDYAYQVKNNPAPAEQVPAEEISLAVELAKVQDLQKRRREWTEQCNKITTANQEKIKEQKTAIADIKQAIETVKNSIRTGIDNIALKEDAIRRLQEEINQIKADNHTLENSVNEMERKL